jgi:hypothetical protein
MCLTLGFFLARLWRELWICAQLVDAAVAEFSLLRLWICCG